MSARTEGAAEAAIGLACRLLHLPTVRDDHEHLAVAAASEHLTHRAYLAEVLTAEVDEREGRRRARRVVEARLARVKRLSVLDCVACTEGRRIGRPV